MSVHLNIVHLLLLLAGAGCAYFALREVRRTYISVWRLFVPPLLGSVAALGLALGEIAANQPSRLFGGVLLAGVLVGAARGFTLPIQVDNYYAIARTSRPAKLVLLAVSLVLLACVLLEVAGAILVPRIDFFRLPAALLCLLCASMMVGRAAAIAARITYVHRAYA